MASGTSDPHSFLTRLFNAAIDSARPEHIVTQHLPDPPKGKIVVVGAGKASAAMAQVVERHYGTPLSGCVVTPYGHAVSCQYIKVLEAAHPVPDKAGQQAAQHILNSIQGLSQDDLVIVLLSGGGSALLPLPAPGLVLADKQAISTALLRSGASISEINTVRRHLSAIKGGRLAASCHPARVLNLMISDVPGDHPADIASGPTVGDPTTSADALAILGQYHIAVPETVRRVLNHPDNETVKPDDACLNRVTTHIIASSQHALTAAADVAQSAGISPLILGDSIEGEAREAGKIMAGIAKQVGRHGQPVTAPCVLLSGGETTVTVRGHGRGGRNVEFLLAMAVALRGEPNIYALAGDTDGIDGQEAIAGAYIDPGTLQRAGQAGLSARTHLDNNDAHTFFEGLDQHIVTGPTRTNVNDFRAILIL